MFEQVEVSDIFGVGKITEKFLDVISKGVGKIYEPIHIKRMAKARSEELNIIHNSLPEEQKGLLTNFHYQNGSTELTYESKQTLQQRMNERLLYQEMKRQNNIDNIVINAYNEMSCFDSVSGKALDENWITAFFDLSANISESQMQLIWGKILAGEIKEPGSFSIRTLDLLRKMSSDEANLFAKISPFILRCKGDSTGNLIDYFLMDGLNGQLLKKYGIDFPKILLLNEAGLIIDNTWISFAIEIEPAQTEYISGITGKIAVKNLGTETYKLSHSAFLLTEAGKELWKISSMASDNKERSKEYMKECLEELNERVANSYSKNDMKEQLIIEFLAKERQ